MQAVPTPSHIGSHETLRLTSDPTGLSGGYSPPWPSSLLLHSHTKRHLKGSWTWRIQMCMDMCASVTSWHLRGNDLQFWQHLPLIASFYPPKLFLLPLIQTVFPPLLNYYRKGYTHCFIKGWMSLPETFEMDFKNPDVETNIWLHICDWNFWDEAVLAKLSSLLKTCKKVSFSISV